MAATKYLPTNADHRNTESEADSLSGASNVAPLDSNADSSTSNHSAESHRDGPREIITDALALPTSSTECNSNGPECSPPTSEDKCSTGTSDTIAIAVSECLKVTTLQHSSPDNSRYRPRPVKDITIYKSFPRAARQRELSSEATKFSGNPRNIFVHYFGPVLELRRKEKLASGTTKQKFYFNAARLWAEMQTIEDLHEQRFFWNQKSVEMKLALKKKSLAAEGLLEKAGFEEDWWECRKYAEMAVGWYLGQDPPREFVDGTEDGVATAITPGDHGSSLESELPDIEKKLHDLPCGVSRLSFHHGPPDVAKPSTNDDHPLLDVLPKPFSYKPKMMYGQFAHANYTEIRQLDGSQQAARLRQLADLFDPTGKVLFYYYAHPHIW